ncbi:probable G-protein coupled receptor 141 [Hippoglossus hippoglossus]|uniref:probable G-protein coupled receptor 141 n=1 Tax=Hippoglossus hippoglossus TaxID=8267 RepID=UPI00148DBF3A|nr:probable G-protein coupled receptor 141 [Hippoglossus hippoglossus]
MNSTVAQSAQGPKNEYHHILAAINAVVLVSGTVSLSLMMHILKSSSTSITSIAVLNLIFTHFIFLITVPFRIYYYATSTWDLGVGWCRMISSMIHVHMYMSFLFYVIILITRLRAFYRKAEQLASFRSIHALLVSAAVWLVLLIVVPLTICLTYGQNNTTYNGGSCVSTANVSNTDSMLLHTSVTRSHHLRRTARVRNEGMRSWKRTEERKDGQEHGDTVRLYESLPPTLE